jgi:trehalose 6-phosphate synthase
MTIAQENNRRRLIIVSNRGPIEHTIDKDGTLKARRGAGGMVTALQPAARFAPPGSFTWIAVAMTEADRAIASQQDASRTAENPSAFSENTASANGHPRLRRKSQDQKGQLPPTRYVNVPPAVYERYYDGISNRILWCLQHYLWNTSEEPTFTAQQYQQWEQGYRIVNQAIANTVCEEVARRTSPALVMFQDYHLYLVPGLVRERLEQEGRIAETILHHFIHIPWPTARYWQLLPRQMLKGIYQSLLANDLIGFQTERDMANFAYSVQALVDDTKITQDKRGWCITWRGHTTLARSYPISIDVQEVLQEGAHGAHQYEREVCQMLGKFTFMRVDRVEPTKNIVRGFQAFEELLKRRPDLAGSVRFLAFLVPSRQGLPSYKRYEREVRKIIQKINTTYGRADWKPIEAFFENNRARAMAAMRYYDALLVNPVMDGMNLVAKEGPIVNQCDGVLILSEIAGAAQQLGEASLTIVPTDVEETTQALIRALEMPPDERRQRAQQIRTSIERNDLEAWLNQQFADVGEVARERATQSPLQSGKGS